MSTGFTNKRCIAHWSIPLLLVLLGASRFGLRFQGHCEAVPRAYGPWPGGLRAVTPVMAHGPEACEPSHPCGSR